MIIKDIENQIISERIHYGSLYLVCKDPESGDLQKYYAVRSDKDRAFWRLVQHGQPIINRKSQSRETMDKIYSLLAVQ
ncbi:hypothetical protein [Endozoicomonas sp.]|uniref:hypothetical protein n=1 Tax=Endozoicomonas sp. TaxID=1892382 RepID=UPI00383B7CB8